MSNFEVKPLSRKSIKLLKKAGSKATKEMLNKVTAGSEVAVTSDGIEDLMDDFLKAAFPDRLGEIDELPYNEALGLFQALMAKTFGAVSGEEIKN
jgi:hypothetical protein